MARTAWTLLPWEISTNVCDNTFAVADNDRHRKKVSGAGHKIKPCLTCDNFKVVARDVQYVMF